MNKMKIIFTNHAKQRMYERNIKFEQIKDSINFPDYTIRKGNKTEIYKKFEEKTLKVVYIEEGNFIKIITLIWK